MVLPDVLELGLRVVFCGTAVGVTSARVSCYYAGPGNSFWGVLCRTGLTPRKLDPCEFRALHKYGIGLTDLVKTRSGSDKALSLSDFDVPSLCSKIKSFKPKVLAFNGKKAARMFFGRPVCYGGPKPDKRIGETVIFVLPSTAPSARKYWVESHWSEFANFVGG